VTWVKLSRLVRLAGQDFWKFISGDDELYREIIKPIDEKAKQKSKTFKTAYSAKVNEMTAEFIMDFTVEGQIDWIKLIDYVSKRDAGGSTAGSVAEATEESAIDLGAAENDI
jgi:hypothetical protein